MAAIISFLFLALLCAASVPLYLGILFVIYRITGGKLSFVAWCRAMRF